MIESSLPLRIVIVGHVDHGKSTLVGRFLHDTGALPEGKFESIQASCRRRGVPFEWAFLMDALQAERDQNITIDVSQIAFKTAAGRPGVLIDAPGHKEFLKNMITGAARADAALLLIAANEGVREQSRRHGYLLSLLGLKQVAVVVNKMDLVDYNEQVFRDIEKEYREFLAGFGVEPQAFIPISAREGENVATGATKTMPWFRGPAVLEVLDHFQPPQPPADGPLRLPIQDVYRFDRRRILAGRIESGTLRVGDELVFSPFNKTAVVASIERWPEIPDAPPTQSASAGESVGITLAEQIFVERGHVASHRADAPMESNRVKANLFWLGQRDLAVGGRYRLKLATQALDCQIASIERVLDASQATVRAGAESVAKNDVAEVTFELRAPLVFDNHDRIPELGRFVLVDLDEAHAVSGGGILFGGTYTDRAFVKSQNITWSEGEISAADRARRNGHRGAVIWLTGLSGAGKSTLAQALERELFSQNMQAYVLDGDNVRHGLNSNLGFSPEDRVENIRRVAEVARLMADAGIVVITAFISPYRQDRRRAREIALEGGCEFIEVFVHAPLEVCEQRDPKQLYKKARAGQIKQFTGIDAPYEAPEAPEIVIRTNEQPVAESVRLALVNLLPRLR
ncbi:MAG: adenylyl-sulfate kinase [Verrucomicrobia bacterium]|nr:adenylyl-sulfate kinase [Verrucomicrobiota bacterium]